MTKFSFFQNYRYASRRDKVFVVLVVLLILSIVVNVFQTLRTSRKQTIENTAISMENLCKLEIYNHTKDKTLIFTIKIPRYEYKRTNIGECTIIYELQKNFSFNYPNINLNLISLESVELFKIYESCFGKSLPPGRNLELNYKWILMAVKFDKIAMINCQRK